MIISKKRFVLIPLLFAMAFIGTSGYADSTAGTAVLSTYENAQYGIRIDYPVDWTCQEGVSGILVLLLAPPDGAADNFRENVNLIVQDLSGQNIDLDSFTRISNEQLKAYITDFRPLTSERIKFNNNDAQKIVYTGKQGQYDLKFMQIWMIKNNKAYILTFTAVSDKYDQYINIINQMINSFRF